MKRLGLVFVLVLFAPACGGDPPPVERDEVQRSDLEQAAHELLQVQNGHHMFAAKFTKRPSALTRRFAWFRYEIGTCDRYELYQDFGPKRARFVYHCERGQLEALIGLDDDGRVKELRTGARGVNPPKRVWKAAERWLESPAAAEAGAKDCRIDRVHLGASTGALFVLVCPSGEKTLVINVNRKGEPRRLEVIDHALDVWRVPAEVG